MKKKKLLFLLPLLFCLVTVLPVKVNAASLNFNVEPATKTNVKNDYFDFNAQAGKSVSLPLNIENESNKEITIKVSKLNALSSITGGINYTADVEAKDSKLLNSNRLASKYISGPDTITLSPHQSKKVTYTYTGPANVTTGEILGGLSFIQADNNDTSNSNKKSAVQIKTQVARMIAIVARYSKINPNLALGKLSLSEDSSTPYIKIGMTNEPAALGQISKISYTLKNEKGKTIGHSTTAKNTAMLFAPSSKWKYQIAWPASSYKPGKYTITLEIATVNPAQYLKKTYHFTVKKSNVNDYAAKKGESPTVQGDNWIKYVIIGLVALVIILIITVVALLRKNKQNAE